MAANLPPNATPKVVEVEAAEAPRITSDIQRVGEAMLRRHGVDPQKVGDAEREYLRTVGIDADTYERKALTWGGAIAEFGKPVGPRLYNEVHTTAFGPVPPGRNDINLMSLEDQWMTPRRSNPALQDFETDQEFEERKQKFKARRERVKKLIAAAEAEAEKGGK